MFNAKVCLPADGGTTSFREWLETSPASAVLFLVPMVHCPSMSHAAVNFRCLHVLAWGHVAHLHQGLSQPFSLSDSSALA